MRAMAATAVSANLLAFLIVGGTYWLGYRRLERRAIEGLEPTGGGPGRLGASVRRTLLGSRIRDPAEWAVFSFTVKSLTRSRRHRLALAAYIGFGLAVVVAGFLGPALRRESIATSMPDVMLVSVPLVVSFFTVVGLRVLLNLPTELKAGWIFRMTETDDKRVYLRSVRKAILILGLGTTVVITFPVYAALWGVQIAAEHAAFWLLMGAVLVEALLLTYRSVPFTYPYVPGKTNVKLLWPLYLLAMTTYSFTASRIGVWLLGEPVRWLSGCATLVVALALVRSYQSHARSFTEPLRFEEGVEPGVQRLGIAT
jgi:hypothetical protein